MDAKNTPNPANQKAGSHTENDFPDCRTRILGGTDLAECLMNTMGCKWALPFGETRFCKHPSKSSSLNKISRI